MATKYTEKFRLDAVGIATTSGFTRPQVSSDLGVELSTLNKWVQKHQQDDLMSGPHEDLGRENERLRKDVRLLREERDVLKKRQQLISNYSKQSRFDATVGKPDQKQKGQSSSISMASTIHGGVIHRWAAKAPWPLNERLPK